MTTLTQVACSYISVSQQLAKCNLALKTVGARVPGPRVLRSVGPVFTVSPSTEVNHVARITTWQLKNNQSDIGIKFMHVFLLLCLMLHQIQA